MLERVAPHLAMVGIHKNGTWAAQKIIECSRSDEERRLVCGHLAPFAPPLMCDSLGNYVCAGTLRFGGPWSDYVFDAMMDRMWDIAQNRFGARCMRTCLESQYTSHYQRVCQSGFSPNRTDMQKRVSTGIILNSIPLATNPNGALLLTWLVDQSNLPGRYGLLAGRFVPHIAHLSTHKLASLTVLRSKSIYRIRNQLTASHHTDRRAIRRYYSYQRHFHLDKRCHLDRNPDRCEQRCSGHRQDHRDLFPRSGRQRCHA